MRLKESFLLNPPSTFRDQYDLYREGLLELVRALDSPSVVRQYFGQGDVAMTVNLVPMGLNQPVLYRCFVLIGERQVDGKYLAYQRSRSFKFDLAVLKVGDVQADPADMLPVVADEFFALLQVFDYVEPSPLRNRLIVWRLCNP